MHIYGSVGPQLEKCEIELFWPVDSTHDEASKCKNVDLLALWNALLKTVFWVNSIDSHIFIIKWIIKLPLYI